jgi:hypothetical protein
MQKIVAAIVGLGISSTLAIDLPARAAHRDLSIDRQDGSTLVANNHMKKGKKMKPRMKAKMGKMKRM